MSIPDYRNSKGLWAKSGRVGGKRVDTKSCVKWRDMSTRCDAGSTHRKREPSYNGCSMSANFKDYQFFTDWHMQQVGYGIDGYHLDKDILFTGNKLYSENTCVLVPSALNNFLCFGDAGRGEWPQGVSWSTQSCVFVAHIRWNNKSMYLGRYHTPEAAAEAYKVAKEAHARDWYERLKTGEFVVDERVVERMRTWTFEEVLNDGAL